MPHSWRDEKPSWNAENGDRRKGSRKGKGDRRSENRSYRMSTNIYQKAKRLMGKFKDALQRAAAVDQGLGITGEVRKNLEEPLPKSLQRKPEDYQRRAVRDAPKLPKGLIPQQPQRHGAAGSPPPAGGGGGSEPGGPKRTR